MEALQMDKQIDSHAFKFDDMGNCLDNYQINEIIGEGSFGEVYSAIDLNTGEKVAIKKITDLDNDTVELVREINICKHMKSNHIVQLKDVIPIYNKESTRNDMLLEELYIVMQLSDTDLRKLSKSETYLTTEQVKKIMYEILAGLDYIHKSGLVHRDIKPGNILINLAD
mmetsp:Transcript_11061/g.10984  ORF Transcript_11061/g.10984 Transcript_11061/m.10984 type:complete len:169 (+) Transcript_11061:22-528(+)